MHLVGDGHADATAADAVFYRDHRAMARGIGDHRRIEWRAAAYVPQRWSDALLLEDLQRLLGCADHSADRQHADVAVAFAETASLEAAADVELADLTSGTTGVSDHHRTAVGERHRVMQHRVQFLSARGSEHAHARHL